MRTATRLLAAATLVVGCTDRAEIATGPVSAPAAIQEDLRALETDEPRYRPHLLRRARAERASGALAINDSGVAVGFADMEFQLDPPESYPHSCYAASATVYRAGKVQSLHREIARAMGGGTVCEFWSMATGINDRGDVIGTVWETNTHRVSGFVWSPTTGVSITTVIGPTHLSGINNAGVAVGHHHPEGYGTGGRWPVVWNYSSRAVVAAPAIIRDYFFWDITDDGQLAGCINFRPIYYDATGALRRLEDHCGGRPRLIDRWSVFPLTFGGINASGTVVFSGQSGPTIWHAGSGHRTTSAGWPSGAATGISDAGRVVGWRASWTEPASYAMTRGPGGRVLQLASPLPGAESQAYGVNTCGTIVGVTVGTDGNPRATQWSTARCDTR